MKANIASNILKVLLVLFIIGLIFFGSYVLPIIAEQNVQYYPELEYVKIPILVVCELLLFMLLVGIGIIIYLLVIIDKGNTFSVKFIKGLDALTVICIIASIVVISLLFFLRSLGGPGPMLSLIMLGLILLIWIVAAIFAIAKGIVKKVMD